MPVTELNWAKSNTIGHSTEITVLAPIRIGQVLSDGVYERRTYEERVRSRLANLSQRAAAGIPIDLDKVASIHYGRITIIRPEHYLLYSDLKEIKYKDNSAAFPRNEQSGKIPQEIDVYIEGENAGKTDVPIVRSFILTQVSFSGDLRTYFRHITQFLGKDFDYIFENCEDYPTADDFDSFWQWIRRYQLRADLFYSRYPDLSVPRIKQLERFKQKFDEFVAKVRTPDGEKVGSMDELFDEFLADNMQFAAGWPSRGGIYKRGDG